MEQMRALLGAAISSPPRFPGSRVGPGRISGAAFADTPSTATRDSDKKTTIAIRVNDLAILSIVSPSTNAVRPADERNP
jgi:hypothetical protein